MKSDAAAPGLKMDAQWILSRASWVATIIPINIHFQEHYLYLSFKKIRLGGFENIESL